VINLAVKCFGLHATHVVGVFSSLLPVESIAESIVFGSPEATMFVDLSVKWFAWQTLS